VGSVSMRVLLPDRSDNQEPDRAVRELHEEVLRLDVESVTFGEIEFPPFLAKSDGISVMALVAVANSVVLASLLQIVRAWIARDHGRSVTLKDGERELRLTGANAKQHQQLIDAFLAAPPDTANPEPGEGAPHDQSPAQVSPLGLADDVP
jgi:hypothetical protein